LPIGPNKTILLSNTPYMVAGFGRRCVAGFGAPNDIPASAVPNRIGILPFVRSDLAALRPSGFACQLRRLDGTGSPSR
jgi:hypothetical protein